MTNKNDTEYIYIPVFDLRHPKCLPSKRLKTVNPGDYTIITNQFGEIIIEYAAKATPLTANDIKNFWATFHLAKTKNEKDHNFNFIISLSEIAQTRKLTRGGRQLRDIIESLIKISYTKILSQGKVWTSLSQQIYIKVSSLISDLTFIREETEIIKKKKQYIKVRFGTIYESAIKNNNETIRIPSKILDLHGVEFNLATFFIGQNLTNTTRTCTFSEKKLLEESLLTIIPTTHKFPRQAKQKLRQSLQSLIKKEFIEIAEKEGPAYKITISPRPTITAETQEIDENSLTEFPCFNVFGNTYGPTLETKFKEILSQVEHLRSVDILAAYCVKNNWTIEDIERLIKIKQQQAKNKQSAAALIFTAIKNNLKLSQEDLEWEKKKTTEEELPQKRQAVIKFLINNKDCWHYWEGKKIISWNQYNIILENNEYIPFTEIDISKIKKVKKIYPRRPYNPPKKFQ